MGSSSTDILEFHFKDILKIKIFVQGRGVDHTYFTKPGWAGVGGR